MAPDRSQTATGILWGRVCASFASIIHSTEPPSPAGCRGVAPLFPAPVSPKAQSTASPSQRRARCPASAQRLSTDWGVSELRSKQYDVLVISWCVPAPRSRLPLRGDGGPAHVECWAKTTADGRPGISVRDHCLNVGCIAEALLELLPDYLRKLLPPSAA